MYTRVPKMSASLHAFPEVSRAVKGQIDEAVTK